MTLRLPDEWTVSLKEMSIEAFSPKGTIEIVSGSMPEDNTAESQIFANYAEMVGFDSDEEQAPIQCFRFNGKKAWGFCVYDEENNLVNVFCQECKKGICVIFTIAAPDFNQMNEIMSLTEKGFRI